MEQKMNKACNTRLLQPKNADIVVVGAGLAGLTAALVSAQAGKKVTLLAAGAGALSIGSGCIDLLGYVDGKAVQGNPLDFIANLPPEHPYPLIGKTAVQSALDFFEQLCRAEHWPLLPTEDKNHWLPTIMGTLKPSYLCPPSSNGRSLEEARSVTVLGIEGIKDCQPELITQQLSNYPHLKDKTYTCLCLPSPFGKTHRNISPLDVARYIDTQQGLDWLVRSLKALHLRTDVLLLPPICGTRASSEAWMSLQQNLDCKVIEMLSIPPGVGGLRLRELLMRALRNYSVNIVENTRVHSAHTSNGRCIAVLATCSTGSTEYRADSFIIATGGFLGEGLIAEAGSAHECIFKFPIAAPQKVEDWSDPHIFGRHAFASMGVRTDSRLLALTADSQKLLSNVHFAGRILGGYDFASEKSGNGVALATGWHAAKQVV